MITFTGKDQYRKTLKAFSIVELVSNGNACKLGLAQTRFSDRPKE
jgi:hypothetical protein